MFCSHQCSPECSMNKFRAYISTYTCFVLPRTHQYIYTYICIFLFGFINLWSYFCRLLVTNFLYSRLLIGGEWEIASNICVKEPQTIGRYWFYLFCNHVPTSTKSKLFVTYTFYTHKLQCIFNKLCPSSTTWPASWTNFSFLAPRLSFFETSQ